MANPFDQFDAPSGNPFDKFDEQPAKPKKSPGVNDRGGLFQNMAGAVLSGAGDIGATLLTPIDAAARAFGVQNSFIGRDDRRQAINDALVTTGVDPNSLEFKGTKLATQVLGTAGAGGVIAKPVAMFAPKLAAAIASGGFSAGGAGLGTRMAGGAISGGTAAGLVNPEDAGTGAMVGGAMPGVIKVAGEAGKLAGKGISGLTKQTLGMTTGAGAETFGTAFQAGKQGGTSFLDNMRGNVPMTDVLDSAKDALSKMRIDRGNQYRSGMVDIANDKSVINFAPIDKAVQSLKTMGSFKGQTINKNAAGTVDEIAGLVDNWKGLDPAEYHTPEGLDALKKAIGDVRDATQFGTPGRRAADTAYNAVKSQIEFQAPTYSKVMREYSQASEALTEVEKALSLGNKAAADTSMRKLQSLMRNNVNTNYGNRLDLAKKLEEQGADILPAVAGQAASSWTPRGLQGLAATGAGMASLMNPATLAALPFTSPRLMGEAAYGLGALSRGLGSAASGVGGQASRLLPRNSMGLLDFDSMAPVLSTLPVISATRE